MAQHAILRFEKHKGNPARPLEAHHERQKEQYASNPDIDTSRSKYNFHILPALGNCKLIEINTVLLADFMNDKLQNGRIDRNGGLSPSYVRTIILDCNNCLLIMAYFLF